MADKNDDPVQTYTSSEYTEKYSNNLSVECRFLDFRLRFGLSVHAEPGEKCPMMMVEYFQAILLSPQEAKLMLSLLYQELCRYEESFGRIPALAVAPPAPKTEDVSAPDAPVPAIN